MGSARGHKRIWRTAFALAALTLVLSACLASQEPAATVPRVESPPGFLLGLWQGFMAPVGFIVSIFTDSVRMYSVPNVGRWYDFGFMLGIGGFSSGIFAGSRRRRR